MRAGFALCLFDQLRTSDVSGWGVERAVDQSAGRSRHPDVAVLSADVHTAGAPNGRALVDPVGESHGTDFRQPACECCVQAAAHRVLDHRAAHGIERADLEVAVIACSGDTYELIDR